VINVAIDQYGKKRDYLLNKPYGVRLNLRILPTIIPQGQPYGDVKADSGRKTDDQYIPPVTVAARRLQSSLNLLLTIHRAQSLGYWTTIRDSTGD